MNTADLARWMTGHAPGSWIGAAAVALAVLLLMHRAVRFLKRWDLADVITVLIALAGTVYAGTGTWKYLDQAMGYGPDLRAVLVSVFEGAVIAEGLRARRNITTEGKAGVDGTALWVLTGVSAMLSASESSNLREAAGRLLVPCAAAFLWERLLAPQRRARKGLRPPSPIRWRITGERIAVWLRLADAVDTSVSAIESARKVVRFLKATDRAARKWRRPWSPAARADRARTKLAAHALLHHGDPTAVHTQLAQRMLDEALRRLSDQPSEPQRPITPADQPGTSDAPVLAAEGAFSEVTVDFPEHLSAPGVPVLMVASQESSVNTPVDRGVLTGVKTLSTNGSESERISTERAEEIMRFAWESGMGVRAAARAADRDPAQVSRRFARLDAEHGPRARQDDADGIPLVTLANGSTA